MSVLHESAERAISDTSIDVRHEGSPCRGQRDAALDREALRAARARNAERRAAAAAARLNDTVIWTDGTVFLDHRVVLGELLTHPSAKWVGFEFDGAEPINIWKQKLRAARAALRPFDDLRAYADEHGLHFRWHSGKGGLNLFSQEVQRHERDRVFQVPLRLMPPEPTVVTTTPPADRPAAARRGHRRPRGGAWLGQVLSDLGLLG